MKTLLSSALSPSTPTNYSSAILTSVFFISVFFLSPSSADDRDTHNEHRLTSGESG